MEKTLILTAILLPALTSLLLAASSLFTRLSEKTISIVSQACLWLTFLVSLLTGLYWVLFHAKPFIVEAGIIYRTHEYSFPFTLLIDQYSLIYVFLTTILANITAKYSRYYLHREEGYLRYFSLILFMVAGSNLVAFSGTLDLLFAGWEIIGLSSFCLISFYWMRHQPARNSLVAFIVYRVCDVGLLAATMLGHVLETDGGSFVSFDRISSLLNNLPGAHHDWILKSIALLLVFASLGKSAQFPFMNWLPRAMEGPTPSSAIFYGALSIHAGVFLLIRTEPLWHLYPSIRLTLALIGLVSAVCATLIGRTLSNIKGQLAYAAIAQVGLMFIELALDLRVLTTTHLVLHAFLRAYQILISPSIVAHALRLIGSNLPVPTSAATFAKRGILPEKVKLALYRLALSDFFLWPSRTSMGFSRKTSFLVKLPDGLALLIVGAAYFLETLVQSLRWAGPHPITSVMACGLMIVISLDAQRGGNAFAVWFKVWQGLFLGFISFYFLDPVTAWGAISSYFITALFGLSVGSVALQRLGNLSLDSNHGRMKSAPWMSYLFLGSLLLIGGIPPAPSFVAEDLLLHWSFEHGLFWAFSITLTLTLTTIATARIYTRVCLGPTTPNES